MAAVKRHSAFPKDPHLIPSTNTGISHPPVTLATGHLTHFSGFHEDTHTAYIHTDTHTHINFFVVFFQDRASLCDFGACPETSFL